MVNSTHTRASGDVCVDWKRDTICRRNSTAGRERRGEFAPALGRLSPSKRARADRVHNGEGGGITGSKQAAVA